MNRILSKLVIALGFAASLACIPAHSAVITFDDPVSNAQVYSNSTTLNVGGLTFASGAGGGVWGFNPNDNGTNAWINGFGASTTITKTGGGIFDLSNFDMTISWYNSNPSETITVNGNSIVLGQGMQNYAFGFTGVSSVVITGIAEGYWALDNVNYSVAAVPEPETYAMLIAGLGLLGFAARRRKLKLAA